MNPAPNPTLLLPTAQIVLVVLGALVPLVTYVLNHYAPWASEQIKAIVVVVVAAVVAGVYQAIQDGHSLDKQTLQYVITAVVAALGAHHWLYKPAGISEKLGGGSNAKE